VKTFSSPTSENEKKHRDADKGDEWVNLDSPEEEEEEFGPAKASPTKIEPSEDSLE